MKKLFLLICLFLFINVNAETIDYKEYSYIITINGEKYSVSAKYRDENPNASDDEERYSFDSESLSITNSAGEVFRFSYSSGQFSIASLVSLTYCSNSGSNTYPCINNKTFYSLNELESGNYLPKFIDFNNNEFSIFGSASFLYYIADESNISVDEKNKLVNSLKYNYENISLDNFQNDLVYNSSNDVTYDINSGYFDTQDISSSAYLERAEALRSLVESAYDINICTENDLNKIRTLRDVSLLEKRDSLVNIPLSSGCYSVLFGGNDNIYSKVIQGYNYMSTGGAEKINNKLMMAYYYYETYYLMGVSLLEGTVMNQEIEDVTRCNLLGDKTTEIIQYGFDILKFGGIIIGALLCVVDVFKAVVSKEDSQKKQFGVLFKRILAIVALILTPILVEIIFEFINTIGIDDPICGIR